MQVETLHASDKKCLEAVYNQAFEQLRYYITWRERMLVGFLAVNVTLVVSITWLREHGYQQLYWTVFLGGTFLGFMFKHLERRNQTLSHVCQTVALEIEKEWNLRRDELTKHNTGLAFTLNASFKLSGMQDVKGGSHEVVKNSVTHAALLSALFESVIWIMFGGFVFSVVYYNLSHLTGNAIHNVIQYCHDPFFIAIPFVAIASLISLKLWFESNKTIKAVNAIRKD